MDKSLFIFILIGIGFLYFITNFVGDIQKEDEVYQNSGYQQEHRFDKYYTTDSIGDTVLDLTDASEKEQKEAWQASPLRQEFLSFYPDFSMMKQFVRERTRGSSFQDKMLKNIKKIEEQFLSGKINAEQAKRMLGTIP